MAGLVAACGGSSGDQALADKAVLRSGDLPSAGEGLSWYADPPDETALINSCVDVDLPGHVVRATAASDYFMSSQIGDVTSFAAVYEGPAASALGPMAERVTTCIRHARTAGKVRRLSFPGLGAAARALEVESDLGREEVALIAKARSLAVVWYLPELSCGGRLCGATREQVSAFVHDVLVGMARHLAARM
jgi:hypothetical protein